MSYTIQSGDSLWGIATKECGAKNNADIQKVIDEIVELNNLGSANTTIFSGDTLKLPSDIFELTQKADGEQSQMQTGLQSSQENQTFDFPTFGNKMPFEDNQNSFFPQKNNEPDIIEVNIFQFLSSLSGRSGMQTLLSGIASLFGTVESPISVTISSTKETSKTEYSTSSKKKTKEEQKQEYEENLKNTANGNFKNLNKDETISYDYFLNWYKTGITSQKREIYSENEEKLKSAYENLDTNGDGVLDSDEIEDMFEAFNKIDKEIDKIIKNENMDKQDPENKTIIQA